MCAKTGWNARAWNDVLFYCFSLSCATINLDLFVVRKVDMEKKIEKDFSSPKHRKLLNSAFLLDLFSWFTLILGILRFVVHFYDNIIQSGFLFYILTLPSMNFDFVVMI